MAQKNGTLTAAQAEIIIEGSALSLPAWPAELAGAGLLDAAQALADTP